jgi:CheY-like chemotaxis protein
MPEDNKPENILLVDDDEFIRDIYSTKFSESGVDVTTAENGKRALEMLAEKDFDVVLVDMIMPKMDGAEFLERFYESHDQQSQKGVVIILSNQGQPKDVDKAQAFDIDGYIIKANNVPSEVLDEITRIYNQ